MGQNIGSTENMIGDGVRLVNEERAARRGEGKTLAGTRGNRFLHQTAQARAGELSSNYVGFEGAVPVDERSPTERATSGKRLPNGALAAFPGTKVVEVVVTGCVHISEAFQVALTIPASAAAINLAEATDIGVGVDGSECAGLFVFQMGVGTGDRSGVLETDENVPLIASNWNPENVASREGRKVQVRVYE